MITIIILLILAGVAINVVFNQGDLFGKANNVVEKWNNKIAEEAELINTIFEELSGGEEIEITDNVEFSGVPESWTQESITVTISHPNIPEGYEIQYKIGEGEWTTGESVVIEQNGIIYGRLYNGTTDDAAAENTKNITIIDKEVPTAPTGIESSATINSITVTASGGTDSISGVAGYQYSTNGTNWTGTIVAGESYTFEGIKAGTEVTIYAKTVDNAGQISTTYQEIVNTTGVEENVTLTSSIPEGTWTSGDVTVTLSHGSIPSGYEIQYKVGSGEWTAGNSALVTNNNTTVYGRLYNTTLADEIAVNSVTITNIDKEAPTAPTGITSSVTINSITITATGGADTPSGVAGYQYRINSGEWSGTIPNGTSYTFSGLTAATNYTIEARTVDNVGITSSAYTKVIQSGSIKITGITLANKTLTKTGTTNPTVTITPTITPSNATNKGVTWSSSNPAVATVNASGVVTYVKEGTTIITATAQDGSGIKGTCTVTCTENIKVTGISLFHPTLFPESPTYTIVPQITPSNATNKGVSWSSSNPAVATVNTSGVVTYISSGTAVITATAIDGSGVVGKCTVICADGGLYTFYLENNACGGYGTTMTKTWNLDLTNISNLGFELWVGTNAYYGWQVFVELIVGDNQVVYKAGQSSSGSNDGFILEQSSWDVGNISQATLKMTVYGRKVPGDDWGYTWGGLRIINIW